MVMTGSDSHIGVASCRKAGWLLVAFLLCSMAAMAQVTALDDNLHMNLNGNLGVGYNGAFGNADLQSNHAQGFTGSGELTGYYFHPNFVSFQFRPYYDRNQANSESQTVTRGTGFGGMVNLFGGSHFPGSISYGRDFSSNSDFRLSGIPTISADSSGQSLGITWSALVPDLPTVTANYSIGSNSASLLGSSRSETSSRNFTLSSGYGIAGFDFRGNYSHLNNSFTTPDFLTSVPISSDGSGTSYGLSVQHRLPLAGSMSMGWSHSSFDTGNGSDWSSNSYTAATSFAPWRRLSLYQNATYTTDLTAALSESLVNGIASNLRSDNDSHGVYYGAGATLLVCRGLSLNGHFNHRAQWFGGRRFEDSQYGGNANFNFASRLFGLLYFGVGLVDTASRNGNDGAGLNANVGMNKKFNGWDTAADFSYSHNVQTLVSVINTSFYSYGVSTRRKIGDLKWYGAFRGSRSGFVAQEGNGNNAESFSSGISWNRYSVSGIYSQSDGTAVLTTSGDLTPTPGGSLLTDDFLLFNAHSIGVNATSRVFSKMLVTAGFSKFSSNTLKGEAGSFNSGKRYNVRTEYRLRKFSIIGGFNRSMQDVSTVPGGPRLVNSYYMSLSRWFNVF